MNDKQKELIYWFIVVGIPAVVLLAVLSGCATLMDESDSVHRETGFNSQGVKIWRTYGVGYLPAYGQIKEDVTYAISNEKCMVLYRTEQPSEATRNHAEEGHCNGMEHTPAVRCGEAMCATVTKAGGPYRVGDVIRTRWHFGCIASFCYRDVWEDVTHPDAVTNSSAPVTPLFGASFKPVDIYQLLGVKKP